MRKFLVLFGIFMFWSGICANAEQLPIVKTYSENEHWGLKDKQGNIVVKAEYEKLIPVGNSSWIIQKNNKFGLINPNGDVLVKPKYRHVERVFLKYVKLGNQNDYGLYDENGNAIIPPEYSSIEPLFGGIFLTCKKYKYGVVDQNGKTLLPNKYQDIYMPNPRSMRIQYEGEWFEIEKLASTDISLTEEEKITYEDQSFRISHLAKNTGLISSYSAITTGDYALKLFSSIAPAYEQTVDELMLSKGADIGTVFLRFAWIPKFPVTYVQKYYSTYKNPNNGPLSEIKNDIKKQLK